MARLARSFIDCARLFAALDPASNRAVAYGHGHVVDGRVLRQREDVDRFNLIFEWVLEFLRHDYSRQKAAYLSFNVRVLERAEDCRLPFGAEDLERALSYRA